MTSMQRVIATMAGQPVDHRPFGAVLGLYGSKLTNCPLDRYYTQPEAFARGQMAVLEAFGPDILFSPFALAKIAEAFGGVIRHFDEHPPCLRLAGLASIQEALAAPLPDPLTSPPFDYYTQTVRHMAQQVNGQVPIGGIVLAPMDMPAMIIGIDAWMDALLSDPDSARRFLDHLTPLFVAWANDMLDAGASFLAIVGVFASPAIVPREIAMSVTLPSLRRAMAQIKGPCLYHHSGNPLSPFVDTVSDMPNLAGFGIDWRDDPAALRQHCGQRLTLVGGINGPGLDLITAQAVEQRCRRLFDNRSDDPRYILCTSGADIPLATPAENILTLGKVARNTPGPLQ